MICNYKSQTSTIQCVSSVLEGVSYYIGHLGHTYSVYEKLLATRAKVAPVNLTYGSHFSATDATNIVSQNMRNFVEFTRTFTRITHSQSQYKAYLYSRVYIFTILNSNQLLFMFYESHGILPHIQWRV